MITLAGWKGAELGAGTERYRNPFSTGEPEKRELPMGGSGQGRASHPSPHTALHSSWIQSSCFFRLVRFLFLSGLQKAADASPCHAKSCALQELKLKAADRSLVRDRPAQFQAWGEGWVGGGPVKSADFQPQLPSGAFFFWGGGRVLFKLNQQPNKQMPVSFFCPGI